MDENALAAGVTNAESSNTVVAQGGIGRGERSGRGDGSSRQHDFTKLRGGPGGDAAREHSLELGAIAEPSLERGEKGSLVPEESGSSEQPRWNDPLEPTSEETDFEEDVIAEPALERGSPPPGSIKSTSRRPLPRAVSSPVAPHSILLLQLSTYSLLSFITIWGVLSRLGLEYLGSFATSQVFTTIWPQIVGCLVMGVVVSRKKGLERVYVHPFQGF